MVEAAAEEESTQPKKKKRDTPATLPKLPQSRPKGPALEGFAEEDEEEDEEEEKEEEEEDEDEEEEDGLVRRPGFCVPPQNRKVAVHPPPGDDRSCSLERETSRSAL